MEGRTSQRVSSTGRAQEGGFRIGLSRRVISQRLSGSCLDFGDVSAVYMYNLTLVIYFVRGYDPLVNNELVLFSHF